MSNTNEEFREYLERTFTLARIKTAKSDAEMISKSFFDLSHAMQKDYYDLMESSGCSESAAYFMRLLAALSSRRITDRFKLGKRYSESEILDFIVGRFFGLSAETVYVLLFDEEDRFIACDYVGEGTANSASLVPRRVIDLAKRYGASSTVIAHNHPAGRAEPSSADVSAAYTIEGILVGAGITCKHNYVVSGFDVCDILKTSAYSSGRSEEELMLKVSSVVKDHQKWKRKV